MKAATILGSVSRRLFHPIVIPTAPGLVLTLVTVHAQEGTALTGTISGFDRGRMINSAPLPAAKRDPLIRIPAISHYYFERTPAGHLELDYHTQFRIS